jgi:hypothetical protein
MKKTIIITLGLISMACIAASSFAETNTISSPVTLPKKEKLHLYLLMGQSNMAGRGKIGKEDLTANPRVIMLSTNGNWEAAVDPITKDRKTDLGVGPGLSFGKTMAEKDPTVTIALVPCAVGGTPLSRWQKGGDLYKRAIERAKLAMNDGVLEGVLWHQGESDTGKKENAESYSARLSQMIKDLRTDLGSTNLPVVVGELGEFLYNRPKNKPPFVTLVNDALRKLPETVPLTGCASSKGLKDKGDELHFNAEAQHEFGRRYAAEMIRLQTSLQK